MLRLVPLAERGGDGWGLFNTVAEIGHRPRSVAWSMASVGEAVV
ncbi:hypothetical protein [Pseudomonas sp. NFX15]